MSRILMISLGGTISTRSNERGLNESARSGEEVLAAVPEMRRLANVTTVDIACTRSIGISRQSLLDLVAHVHDGIDEGYDGILITQGTDAMEETVYLLALQVPRKVPIALTGAMRAATQLGQDGPANVLAAATLATDPTAAALGPVVVIQDEIHLARWAAKVHTSSVAAFASPGFGPVGNVTEGRARIWAQPTRPDLLGRAPNLDPRVGLAWVAMGSEASSISSVAPDLDGLVLAGSGGGHAPPAVVGAVRDAASAGVSVVLASRARSGAVLEHTYDGAGSETELIEAGAVPAGMLDPLKARWRLTVALALGLAASDVFPVE